PSDSQQSSVHIDLVLILSLLVLHPSALPILFQEEMLNKEATEGEAVTLHCKLSKSAPVEWRKGNMVLKPSEKYKIEQEGPFAELMIRDLDLADA
ncbi:OBSCN protein, partial [Corythaeola cristata]|nr:OBSCN protein [Corythaeola cristata]